MIITQEHDCSDPHERQHYVHYLRRVRLQDGGVVRAVLDLCSSLAARGHHVTLLTGDATDVPTGWRMGVNNLPRVTGIAVPRLLGALPVATGAAIRGAHVLHLHTPWELSNLALAAAANRMRIPYVLSIHGMLDEWSLRQKWLKKWLFLALVGRRFLAGAARVHCTATAELTQASRFLRPGSGVVLACPIDLCEFADLPGAEPARREYPELAGGTPRILFLSRLDPKKRPDLVIEAVARLDGADQACQLIMAGPGEPAYVAGLRQLAHQRGLGRRVLFTGMVHGLVKVSLFQAADVFVLPTSQENFGIVLVEAMAAGTPVITTRGVDIWQELQSAGALIVDQDPAHIAAAIRSLIADLPAAKQLGQRGRKWVMNELNADRVSGDYERMYRDVCRAPARHISHLAGSEE
jgi:glycosyltransferase involved in cell wall biosynthesis